MLAHCFLRLIAPLSFAIGVTIVAEARAASPVSLVWSAPSDCPSRDEVFAEVNRLLGARAASNEVVLDVTALVKRKQDGSYVVRLEIPGPDGLRFREVSAVSCDALGRATALIVAMMVDPDAVLDAAPVANSSSGNPRQTLAPFAEKFASSFPPAFATPYSVMFAKDGPFQLASGFAVPRLRIMAAFQGLTDIGSLPGVATGLGGVAGVFPGRWRWEFGAAYFLEKSTSFSTIPNAGANVNQWAFYLAGGRAFPLNEHIEIAPRIRLDMGRLHGASFGVSNVGEGHAESLGFGAGAVFSAEIVSHVRLRLDADALVFFYHPQFIVTGIGVAHEPSNLVLRLALGTEVRF